MTKRKPNARRGRPPAAAPMQGISLTLPEEVIDAIKRAGNGNASEGVRRLVAREHGDTTRALDGAAEE